MVNPDYSTYRAQMKALKPDMAEQDIYQWWRGQVSTGWNVQTKAVRGHDGWYHQLYISVADEINKDTGKEDIYIGVHNTLDLNDGYQGSGYDIKAYMDRGKTFKTYPLEFFKTANDAYFAEKEVVNEAFLHSPMVINRELGGKKLENDNIKQETRKTTTKVDESPYRPTDSSKPTTRTHKGDSFKDLKVKVGAYLDYIKDPSKKVKVLDEWYVMCNGQRMGLSKAVSELSGEKFRGNPLHYFNYNGKNLGDIQREIRKKR